MQDRPYREGDDDDAVEAVSEPPPQQPARRQRIQAGPRDVDTAVVLMLIDGQLQMVPFERTPPLSLARSVTDADIQSMLAQGDHQMRVGMNVRVMADMRKLLGDDLKVFTSEVLTKFSEMTGAAKKEEPK